MHVSHPQCEHICPSQRERDEVQTWTGPVLHYNSAIVPYVAKGVV